MRYAVLATIILAIFVGTAAVMFDDLKVIAQGPLKLTPETSLSAQRYIELETTLDRLNSVRLKENDAPENPGQISYFIPALDFPGLLVYVTEAELDSTTFKGQLIRIRDYDHAQALLAAANSPAQVLGENSEEVSELVNEVTSQNYDGSSWLLIKANAERALPLYLLTTGFLSLVALTVFRLMFFR